MIGDVLSVGDGHQGWQTKLSIKKDLELPNCPKTGAMTFKTVLDKGYSLLNPSKSMSPFFLKGMGIATQEPVKFIAIVISSFDILQINYFM